VVVIRDGPIRAANLGVWALVIRDDPIRAGGECVRALVIANDRLEQALPQSVVWPWNQATVAATASRNGVAVQPKVRSNLVLSTTQGRWD
jgi:hypothetical protein